MNNVDLTSIDRFALGLKYRMDLELTKLVPRDNANKALALEKLFNDYMKLSYVEAGAFEVELHDNRFNRVVRYPVRSSFGPKLGSSKNDLTPEVLVETGTRTLTVRGRTEDIDIHIINENNIDARIANISQHGTVVQS